MKPHLVNKIYIQNINNNINNIYCWQDGILEVHFKTWLGCNKI